MLQKSISKSVLARLPSYFSYLKSLETEPPKNISATAIATALGMGDVQVRKDLAQISSLGKPKIGYDYQGLLETMEVFLGYTQLQDVILVGAGRLGTALFEYQGFAEYGLNLAVAFDSNPELLGTTKSGKQILPLSKLPHVVQRLNITMAILAVPASQAQEVCQLLCESGIKGIMNFAPIHLSVGEDVLVHNCNLAATLALLTKQCKEREGIDNHGTGTCNRF